MYKETGFVLFALEIVVGDNINGEILLNPGMQKLPKPGNQNGGNLKYTYYGYIIAPDRDEAENIFSSNGKMAAERRIKNPLTGKSVYDPGNDIPDEEYKMFYDPLAKTAANEEMMKGEEVMHKNGELENQTDTLDTVIDT